MKPWIVLLCRRCSDQAVDRHRRQLGAVRSDDVVVDHRRWGQHRATRTGSTRVVAIEVREDGLHEYGCSGCGGRFRYRRAEILAMAGRARKAGESEVLLLPNLSRPRAS